MELEFHETDNRLGFVPPRTYINECNEPIKSVMRRAV